MSRIEGADLTGDRHPHRVRSWPFRRFDPDPGCARPQRRFWRAGLQLQAQLCCDGPVRDRCADFANRGDRSSKRKSDDFGAGLTGFARATRDDMAIALPVALRGFECMPIEPVMDKMVNATVADIVNKTREVYYYGIAP